MTDLSIDLWTYRCRPKRVVDGDTVVLTIDLGFHVTTEQSVRLVDVAAPELFSGTDREAGALARDLCQGWFVSHDDGSPWPFLVRTERDKQSFARFLGEVWASTGVSLNSYLATEPWR